MSDADPDPSHPQPYLHYSNRPTPPTADDPVAAMLHFAVGFVTYASQVVAMKMIAMRYFWQLPAICGTWLLIMIISFGIAGWLTGAYGWRGAMAGVMVAFIISLIVSGMIVGEP
jgi:hypothetical protein